MKRFMLFGLCALLAAGASAAPNVTNATQKGSLLIFPDVRIKDFDTLIRIENDGSSDVDVLCYWMDGNKNRVDFIFTVTRNAAVAFDARTGRGTVNVNHFPTGPANGIDNPFLWGVTEAGVETPTVDSGAYLRGMLACWAVDGGALNQVKWNHLSGTATGYNGAAAYEYNAYAFYVPSGLDLQPVGVAGTLNLNGVEYDACPLYQIGQFSPSSAQAPGAPQIEETLLSITGCTQDFRQDWTPTWTKLQFDVWNGDEVKFTGAYDCADSWHELSFFEPIQPLRGGFFDSALQNFQPDTLGTYAARYRVQGVKSTQCEKGVTNTTGLYSPAIVTSNVGILAVQLAGGATMKGVIGTTLAGAGKINGAVKWDPEGVVPEGGIH